MNGSKNKEYFIPICRNDTDQIVLFEGEEIGVYFLRSSCNNFFHPTHQTNELS